MSAIECYLGLVCIDIEVGIMAKRKTNKRTVDLLKSNAVSFRNKISRLLLLSSRDERKQFCNEIIRNGILRSKIQHVQYANSLSRFNDIRWCYNPKLSDEDAFDYACFVVSLFHEKVENFNMLRNEYEIAYLSGKYEKALEILDNIDGVICVSLWSLGQRFLIKELRDGLEENKKLLSKIADEVNDDIILCILYYYSSMAESGLSFDNYQTEAMKFIKTLGDSVLGKYICNKLSLESVYQHSDISLTIQLDSQISLIDLFITLEKCLPVHYKNQICDGSALNIPYGVENIKCRLFDNLRVLLKQDIDYSSCHNEQNEKIYEIIECYTAGQYAIVNEKAICYLEKYPNDFQVAVLLCKALILDKKEFPHVLSAHYAKYIYSIYKLDSGYKEAVIQLKHELKRNHGLILGIKIYAFLCRKNIMRGTASNVFVSSILDPCVHPNFSRFLFEAPMNAFTGKMICYSPLAVRLSLSERTGDFDGIKGIVANRAYFLTQAKAYSKNGEYCKAQYILDEYAAINDNPSLNTDERFLKIQLEVFSGQGDHFNAISLLVDSYFRNSFLFERLMSSNIYSPPIRLRNKQIEKDIACPIFAYLNNPGDYSKQISAYNNYLDLNGYSNILDALEKGDIANDDKVYFFFYKVCTIGLLKRDATLHILNVSPESVRISILLKIAEELDNKQVISEIKDILTTETLKDNLKSINKSRINADTDKILFANKDQWQETYSKYLALSELSMPFVKFNIDENDIWTMHVQPSNRHRVTQDNLVFGSLMDQILEECLFSEYGLETYLSSRIRHGYCEGQLTNFLSELHLLSLRTNSDDEEYELDGYWDSKITDVAVCSEVRKALSDFTKKIEQKILEILSEWLRIKYKNKQVGIFDYTQLYAILCEWRKLERIQEFSVLYDRVIGMFWEYTSRILVALRGRIRKELTSFYISSIDELQTQLDAISLTPSLKTELFSKCNVAKSKAVHAMGQFEEVFYVIDANYNNFTMKDLCDSCQRVVLELHNKSDNVKWMINANDDYLLNGKFFLPFVDILCILLNNAFEHSGIAKSEELLIKIDISEITDRDSDQFVFIPDASDCEHAFCMRVTNSLSNSIDTQTLLSKIEGIFKKIRMNQNYRSTIQSEGGSGLFKMCNTAANGIEAQHCILYGIEEHEISFEYCFILDKLLVGEEKCETFNS